MQNRPSQTYRGTGSLNITKSGQDVHPTISSDLFVLGNT